MKKICVSGLNPAWQKTMLFQHFTRGAVNRASKVSLLASGKGINFARAAKFWGSADANVFQFVAGETGKNIKNGLWEEQIGNVSVETPGTTRVCLTAVSVDDSVSTELIEPSPEVPPEAAGELLSLFLGAIRIADALAICGTAPKGINEYFYAELVRQARKNGKFILLDTCMYVQTPLEEGADMLKINRDELFGLTGENDILSAFRTCFQKYKIKYVAITDGPDKALFSDGKKLFRIDIPVLEKVTNPIGCGDTCSAVTLSCILDGMTPLEAFRQGLAAATANCLTELPAFYDKKTALGFLPQLTVTETSLF